ncbi:hypothetical protein RB195_003130 [Necator americanus]|uniref:Endonuclease/exonuclease/phosphatase domain-containing protein n=1 Tax=Necator americanus TaxID=51031 RepID=A0ABR1DMC2_NECAM
MKKKKLKPSISTWKSPKELPEFIMTTTTIHRNSQFGTPPRWTRESPHGGYHNEIDHIIVSKRFCLMNVAAVPKFYTGSNHRLLREVVSFTGRELQSGDKRRPRREKRSLPAEATKTGGSIRYARRNFANRKTKMTALRNPDRTTTTSRS